MKSQVELARQYFLQGKKYLDQLDVLRCKIAGYWYCTRFECVLAAIEKDGYILRANYHERRKLSTRVRLMMLAAALIIRHVTAKNWGAHHDQRNYKWKENIH